MPVVTKVHMYNVRNPLTGDTWKGHARSKDQAVNLAAQVIDIPTGTQVFVIAQGGLLGDHITFNGG